MKKALKFLGLGLIGLIVLVVVVGLFLPSAYAVERSVTIPGASAAKVHPFLNDLNNWPQWEPWTSDDPTIQTTVGTPNAGVGANQSWSGDSGSGNLTLTASTPTGVEFDMDFDGQAARGILVCSENSDSVTVTWKMEGDNGWNLIGRYFGLMMDGIVGPMFQLGLDRLKVAVDNAPAPTPEVAEQDDTRAEEVVEAAEVVNDAATKLLDSLR